MNINRNFVTFKTNIQIMRKIFMLAAIILSVLSVQAKSWTADEVKNTIRKVNSYWQTNHPAEVRSFWDNAAYHTGNMEVYHLLGDENMLDYSIRWAEHNKWTGATEPDKANWKYRNYGEGQDYVLFGDWQICFQTYIDLYNILPADVRVARAMEVMSFEKDSKDHDYWWWVDALYMVMPVMTKMYKLTGDEAYIDKLYDNLTYSDSIMLDSETGLYFRDAKYIYPKHKTLAGKKDFWARGDGWALAGLAKVLQDVPKHNRHYRFFLKKFQTLAESVAKLQQPEGYWTRSMMDPEQAPGPETSGTAFFTYGMLWGINNGCLNETKYMPVVERAWNYLTTKAMQKSGKIGFVQPIGEKAIPGQVIDQNSEANFGTGAWLLAACEYVRYLNRNSVKDRAYWVGLLTQMAEPVLKNMASGELIKNMCVETSQNWDGRDIRVAYMECFGRLMAGVAPWLALPDDGTAEGQQRMQMRRWALASYKNAVDPDNPDYLCWGVAGQNLVDAAYIAESFLRGWDALWRPLDTTTKQRYIKEFAGMRSIDPPYTNWLLFSSTIESLIFKATAEEPELKKMTRGDEYRVNSACRKMEEWYVGDGWYADGPVFAFDYYTSYVFHPMYLETLRSMYESGTRTRLDYKKYYDRELRRARKHSLILERFISPEGTYPVIGRSTPYRLASLQPLALMAWYDILPEGLTRGQVRAALTKVMHRMFDTQENFKDGFLTIGFCGSQPNIADWYTNNGSLYMTSLCFMPLGLPASHPFWTDAEKPWTQVKAWGGKAFPKDHQWEDGIKTRDLW